MKKKPGWRDLVIVKPVVGDNKILDIIVPIKARPLIMCSEDDLIKSVEPVGDAAKQEGVPHVR